MSDLLDRPALRRRLGSGDLILEMNAAVDSLGDLDGHEAALTVLVRWEQLRDSLAREAGDRRARMRTIDEVEAQINFLGHPSLASHRPAFIAREVLRWILVETHVPPSRSCGLTTASESLSDQFLDSLMDATARNAASSKGAATLAAWQKLDNHLRDGGALPYVWLGARTFSSLTTAERKLVIKNGGRSA